MASWQSSMKSLTDAGGYLLKCGTHHDVVFDVGTPPNTKRFECHRLLLAVRSDVFEKELYYDYEHIAVIPVPDVEEDTFHKMLRYIYTDSLDLSSVAEASKLLLAAKKYNILYLVELCLNFILNNLNSSSNLLQSYELAMELNDTELKDKCEKLIERNAVTIFKSEAFLDASVKVVKSVLELKNLRKVEEHFLFKVVLKWVKAECERQNLQSIPSNLRRIFDPLLSHIKFLSMTQEEFVLGPVASEILELEEVALIMTNIIVPGSKSLPSWCSETKPKETAYIPD